MKTAFSAIKTDTMTISRRTVIGTGLAAMFAAATSTNAAKLLFAGNGIPIGINLYMLGDFYTKDINGALEAVANIGFKTVETNLETHPAEVIKTALKRFGLRCSNLSVLPKSYRGGMSLQTDIGVLAAGAQVVGAEYMTCNLFPLPDHLQLRPAAGENPEQMLARISKSLTADDWKRNADFLNDKGAQFKRHGIQFAYHNHSAEFTPYGDINGLAILLERTDPELVRFHMDVGWVVAAGHDPVALLKAYPRRFHLMHVKDVTAKHQFNTTMKIDTIEVGSGIINWQRVLNAAVAAGVRHFAIEQEPPYALPPIECARKSFAYLNTLEA